MVRTGLSIDPTLNGCATSSSRSSLMRRVFILWVGRYRASRCAAPICKPRDYNLKTHSLVDAQVSLDVGWRVLSTLRPTSYD